MITYGSYSSIKRGSVGGLKDYFFTTADEHVCYVYKNKRLRYNETTKVMSLSLDCGATYSITLDLTGVCTIITRSKIYANGNIMWANQTQCFYSTDNLSTYHESIVLGINGLTFVPETYDNFKSVTHNPDVIVNGVQLDVWGSYTLVNATFNVWYTIDSGITIKSFFKDLMAGFEDYDMRHVDACNQNPLDGSWWFRFGDNVGWPLTKATYNWSTDTWSFDKYILDDTNKGPHVCSGFYFYGDHFFWGQDGGTNGIWRSLYADILDNTKWTRVVTSVYAAGSFFGAENGIIIQADYTNNSVILSYDHGETFEHKALTGGPTIGTEGYYNAGIGPDNNNWFRHEIQEDFESEPSTISTSGITLMMQIIPTAGSN